MSSPINTLILASPSRTPSPLHEGISSRSLVGVRLEHALLARIIRQRRHPTLGRLLAFPGRYHLRHRRRRAPVRPAVLARHVAHVVGKDTQRLGRVVDRIRTARVVVLATTTAASRHPHSRRCGAGRGSGAAATAARAAATDGRHLSSNQK
eukprot:contig_2487_g480